MNQALTVDQISTDNVTLLASEYWSPDSKDDHKPYNSKVIEDVYESEIIATDFASRRVMVLELSQYLENYVWPNYTETASKAHMLSVVVLVNAKFRERVSPWTAFKENLKFFPTFVRDLMKALLDKGNMYTLQEQKFMLIFLNHLYNSIESDFIRDEISHTISYNTLECLSDGQLKKTLQTFPNWAKAIKRTAKLRKKLQPIELENFNFDSKFLSELMKIFLSKIETIPLEGVLDENLVNYCERFLELVIDLESQLPTRRFFNTLVRSCNLVVKCSFSALSQRDEGKLFAQLLYILKIYVTFEINDNTGQPLTNKDVMQNHYDSVQELQTIIFKDFPDHKEFSFSSVAAIDSRQKLVYHLSRLHDDDLKQLCRQLCLVPDQESIEDKTFLLELFVSRYEKRSSQLKAINKMPLYPTEDVIWDETVVPSEYYSGDVCLALPKLNLQFLTLHDYLLRNFDLFRLESTYEIRQDIEDIFWYLQPWQAENGDILFRGSARMAHPIATFAVCEVAKPNLGEDKPSRVRADVSVTLGSQPRDKREWEALRKHDVCLLISIKNPKGPPYNKNAFSPIDYGILNVRGCEIEGMLDANGRVIEEGPEPKPVMKGNNRTFRVLLDSNQYKSDMDQVRVNKSEDVYETFNVIMRRKPKENNFKAVLETIRDLMNTKCVVPAWLLDIILGYGDPGAAHYSKMDNVLTLMDFNDTFINYEHLQASFPMYKITHDADTSLEPPFKLTFHEKLDSKEDATQPTINVEPYTALNRGPYHYTIPKRNTVRFTPTQVEAIRSGMQPGLTMVVGPPGTGKTDVAVQIISNIYHTNPNERTLIVTHSNQALNQLFEKIMALDVDERHLLRLGHGEEALETEKDFSRYGRVNYVLNKRLELLEEVTRLKDSLGVRGEMGASCETAGYFFLQHVLSRWEKFLSQVHPSQGKGLNVADIQEYFPFHLYFSNAPQPLFKAKTFEDDMEIALGCFRYLENIFTQLKEFRPFEMLRSGLDRTRYLLVKEAKIIAMTCTHAALKRHELVHLGFQFDNILMEESAQILEIETFIPLLLQNPEDGRNRLKRWVMIGDHHQLPPVIKNMAFQKFSNMEQSLFTRFIRLGTPSVDLDAQGRARPSICSLYNWRYKNLGNLDHVTSLPEFKVANAGFFHDFQMINVEDLNGEGESAPWKYFYQNVAEAEYAVQIFIYMRLLGYPANSISILTTYNGQKDLIKDVVRERTSMYPPLGSPNKISTVDKFQGQQNDYIILSLVRTRAVGHIRDVRRLIVAMSRARLGLYVLGRVNLFKNCLELQPAFTQLMGRPMKLELAPWETHPTTRLCSETPEGKPVVIEDVTHMSKLVGKVYSEVCTHFQQEEPMQTEIPEAPRKSPKEKKPSRPIHDDSEDEQPVMIINELERQ